jgi:hypothetical protein
MNKTFKSVFVVEIDPSDNTTRWRIRGSGVHGYPDTAPLTAAIIDRLEASGIIVKSYSKGSPANVTSYHLDARFEDGGLTASTGCYWFGERGAWIKGAKAIVTLANILALRSVPQVMGSANVTSVGTK